MPPAKPKSPGNARAELGLGEEELAAMRQDRDVAGSWLDPTRYLPMPFPAGWSLEGIDRLGVLTIVVDARLVLSLGVMEADKGDLLFAVMRAVSGGASAVSETDARPVLDHLRNVQRSFREMQGMEDLFGEGRMWTARVLEGVRDVPGSA